MSAEGLLQDPGLFGPRRLEPGGAHSYMDGVALAREYLHLAAAYPAPMRMVKVGPRLWGGCRPGAAGGLGGIARAVLLLWLQELPADGRRVLS
jgi:hypothetical protein